MESLSSLEVFLFIFYGCDEFHFYNLNINLKTFAYEQFRINYLKVMKLHIREMVAEIEFINLNLIV